MNCSVRKGPAAPPHRRIPGRGRVRRGLPVLEGIGYQQIRGGPILGIDRIDYFEADTRLGLTLGLLDMPEVYGTPEYQCP